MMRRDSVALDPLALFLEAQGLMILDGGLATELEAKGCDLSDELWSAGLLMNRPDLIRDVHLEYLQAGADCISSASYQATIEAFVNRGLTDDEAVALIERSVTLARQARDEFWAQPNNRIGRFEPLVAASIGPYGAFLADGSEFRGDYGLSADELESFHRRRWQILTSCGADLAACETLPSLPEAVALRRLLEQTPGLTAWFSFSCSNDDRINDGSLIADVVRELEDCPQIVALGVNCTPPRFIEGLIQAFKEASDKPVVVYPNSGEGWDAAAKSWVPAGETSVTLASAGGLWLRSGARWAAASAMSDPVARPSSAAGPPVAPT